MIALDAALPQWAINIATGITSVGTVQLVIFLLRRRAELKQMDASVVASDRTSAEPLLRGWEAIAGELKSAAKESLDRANKVEQRMDAERKEFTHSLEQAHAENLRLRGEVAGLRTDLDIATRQVEQLQRQLRSRG